MSVVIPSLRAVVSPAGWVRNALWRSARAVPSLDLRFADNKSLVDATTGQSLVTFTRASTGTFVGSDGLIQTATTNEPRFDHNPTTGESLGLLVEEARTNLLLRSEEFDNAYWIKSNLTVTSNSTTAPSGTTTADTLVEDTLLGIKAVQSAAITVASGQAYTFSCYAKPAGRNFAMFLMIGSFPATILAAFDLTNGTVGTTGGSPITTATNVGNGWYRLSITATSSSAGVTVAQVRPCETSGTSFYQGNGTSGIHVWGAQLEAGAFATSYIPTTTAAATRAADVVSITGSAFSSWYRQDEGTVFARYSFPQSPNTGGARVFVFSNSAATNIIWLRAQGGVNRIYDVTDASVSQATFNQGAYAAGVEYRAALATKANDFGFAENGGAPQSDSSGTMPSVDRLGIGVDASGAAPGNVHIRRLVFWPQRLPNPTLQSLTQ